MAAPYDVALLGATGFTGALTAAELASRAPEGLRLAFAGRDRARLEAVRDRIAATVPAAADAALVSADVTDEASLHALAAATRVLVTTVGPYALHGAPVVAACAAQGTDYLDLTGEPEFVDRMYVAHHEQARQTGARLVHAAGFDSVPHDLGAQFTVEHLPADVPVRIRAYVRAGGRISGGTLASALNGMARVGEARSAARARGAVEPRDPVGRRVALERVPHRDAGFWALPLPTIDPQVVARSARALTRYGPDFTYGHYAAVRRLPIAVGGVLGIGALAAAAQPAPLRRAILGRLPSGAGPTAQQRDRAWFSVRFVGEGGGRRVVCEVSGGDPGYTETSRMLALAALCLASDPLPSTAGQVTTAMAMGPALRRRLDAAGIPFRVLAAD
jgi:short subunit dehydrogenase-like uncharacterized protein